MTREEALNTFLAEIALPHGRRYAAAVSRFQEGFFADTGDLDEAFRRAVDACSRLLPAMKRNADKGPRP